MDGVIWRGDAPIGDLKRIFALIQERGLKYAFATNNGSRTPEQYVERLGEYGVSIEKWQIVTSALGVAELLAERFSIISASPSEPQKTEKIKIFAIGEAGVLLALQDKGFETLSVESADQGQAVVMGIDRQINYEKMCAATLLVRRGIPFFATNPDKTFPTPRGEIPGTGAWISVVVTASGIEPTYAGKPLPTLLELARQRLGTTKEETLVVGDRLETDIAGGQAAGMPVALVLSGVSSRESGEAWRPRLDCIALDLVELVGYD